MATSLDTSVVIALDGIALAEAPEAPLIPSAALREAGIDSHAIAMLVARGVLVRVRYGVYARRETWIAGGVDGRYRMFVKATALAAARPVVVSHHSAAVLYGLPIIGRWPKTMHTIEVGAMGGNSARFTTSHRSVPEPDTVFRDALTVTSLARTLVDVAASSTFLVGVTMVDHALRVEQKRVRDEMEAAVSGAPAPAPALTKADLYAELEAVNPRAGARRAERAIAFANGLSANPGETLSRVRMFELGFEVPELQVHCRVRGRDYWVDYFWRGVRGIGEFDGLVKYTRGAVLGDRDLAEVMMAEKRREDILRKEVDSFCRWDWDTAYSPRLFHAFLLEHDVPRA